MFLSLDIHNKHVSKTVKYFLGMNHDFGHVFSSEHMRIFSFFHSLKSHTCLLEHIISLRIFQLNV